jgi:hypothetical protein
VGRILTAAAYGEELEYAVHSIAMFAGGAITYGPWASSEIDDGKPGTEWNVVNDARARGVDVTK